MTSPRLVFNRPENVTPPGFDGVILRFPFVFAEGDQGEKWCERRSWIDVEASGTLLACWDFLPGDMRPPSLEIACALFLETADHLPLQIRIEGLQEKFFMRLGTHNTSAANPLRGHVFSVEGTELPVRIPEAREV